jgi:AcrR family transcriptional regulator
VTDSVAATEDARVQRSRTLIQHALFDLIVEKGYAAVTVRDIALRAKVNRSTFYRHYLDKADLLAHYLDQLQKDVADAAEQAEQKRIAAPERVPAGLLLLVNHVQEHAAFYRVMLGKHGDPAFVEHFRQLSEQRYRTLFARVATRVTPPDLPTELHVHFISVAFVGSVQWWLENNCPSTSEQFTIWLGQLSMTAAGLTPPAVRQPGS